MRYARWICIGLLVLGLQGAALAQQPGSRLPVTRGELYDSLETQVARALTDSLPVMEARLEGILADSVEAMEARLAAALGDSARAEVNAALADSLPAMQGRLEAILVDSVVAMEARLTAAFGDSARAVVGLVLADSLPAMEARLNATLVDSVLSVVSATLADSLPAMEARLQAWLQASVDTTGIGRLTLRFEADSTAQAARIDSLTSVWGEAGDTTSAGLLYYEDAFGVWHRADATVNTKGSAFAADSVAQGGTCRFQYAGLLTLTKWAARGFKPGDRMVNDSLTAGDISPLDTLRSSIKKMHNLGVMYRDSVTLKIDISPGFWYTR